MKKVFAAGLVVILVVVGAYVLFTAKSGPSSPSRAPAEAAPASAATSSQPKAAEKEPTTEVEVLPDKQQQMGIRTFVAAVMPMKKTLRTVGRVEFDERKLTTVNIKVEGWIEKLYADYTGKYVSKDTPLAEIYSPEMTAVQLEYINLLNMQNIGGLRTQRNIEFSWGDRYGTTGRATAYDFAGLFDVAKQRMALWGISEEQIKEMEKSKKPMKTLTVKSPVSGYVFQKPVFKGNRVGPGEKIFDIVDLSTVWVLADIYEYEIPFVKPGQNARITLSYYPQKTFSSKVDFVYPSLSGQTRTAKARFVISNPKLLLKPQMFTDVEMELDLGNRLAIPETAILDTGMRQVVYVDAGDGLFSARQIKAGDRGNGMVEVLSGLKAGDKVASSAVFLIDSEAKLKGVSQ
jgi:membrane fusion protein, copper/silver efflux system